MQHLFESLRLRHNGKLLCSNKFALKQELTTKEVSIVIFDKLRQKLRDWFMKRNCVIVLENLTIKWKSVSSLRSGPEFRLITMIEFVQFARPELEEKKPYGKLSMASQIAGDLSLS